MSEKELREAAEKILFHPTTNMEASDPLKVALAAEPDVVIGLRQIEEELVSARDGIAVAHRECPDDYEAIAHARGEANALGELSTWWRRRFDIRLTDDGWEYTA